MTRKAHNVDLERTEAARFEDERSYVTHSGHEFLFGVDVRNRREEIYERDKGECQIRLLGCTRRPGWNGHMDHIEGGNTDRRCWCRHNLRWACAACHSKKHVRVLWTKNDPTV
jgi:hypothetical protein